MAFCEHCQGQRFDRAQVLRALREVRQRLRRSNARQTADDAIALAIHSIRSLELPHLEVEAENPSSEWLH